MGIDDLNHRYEAKPSSARAFLLLPGLNGGFSTYLMENIFKRCTERGSTLAIDYPYSHRPNDKPTAGLVEEQATLQTAYEFMRERSPDSPIIIIAKSLGGIIVSNWLEKGMDDPKLKVALLAYDKGEANMKAAPFKGRLVLVIQGELDDYGNSAAISEELAAHGVKAGVIGIPGADHSYRPDHENEAIGALFSGLDTIAV